MKKLMEAIEEALVGTDYEVQSIDVGSGTMIIESSDGEESYAITVEEN